MAGYTARAPAAEAASALHGARVCSASPSAVVAGAPDAPTAMDLSQAGSVTGEAKHEAMDAAGDLTPGNNSDDLGTCRPPFSREQLASMELDLVGVKMVKKPGSGPHVCPMCQLTIRIYGRLVRSPR